MRDLREPEYSGRERTTAAEESLISGRWRHAPFDDDAGDRSDVGDEETAALVEGQGQRTGAGAVDEVEGTHGAIRLYGKAIQGV
jgi:hypothetical protein